MPSFNEPTLTFRTLYLGKITIPASIIVKWTERLDVTDRLEHCAEITLRDGTFLIATDRMTHNARKNKKNWHHC
jgi:hypothetical protein